MLLNSSTLTYMPHEFDKGNYNTFIDHQTNSYDPIDTKVSSKLPKVRCSHMKYKTKHKNKHNEQQTNNLKC
jgi:hypothetical protein